MERRFDPTQLGGRMVHELLLRQATLVSPRYEMQRQTHIQRIMQERYKRARGIAQMHYSRLKNLGDRVKGTYRYLVSESRKRALTKAEVNEYEKMKTIYISRLREYNALIRRLRGGLARPMRPW